VVGISNVMAKHAPPETRKAQILQAAMSCFAERGYHGTSIDDMASLTGLSKGAIYHHFGNKREILLSLLELFADQLLARWRRIGEESSPLEALARDAEAALTVAQEAEPLIRASLEILSHASRDDDLRLRLARVYADARGHLAQIIDRARADGSIEDVDSAHLAAALVGMYEGLFLQQAMDPTAIDVAAAWREGISALLRSLTASSPVKEPAS
jgi:AcrR family transcriptional regulator